MFITVPKSTLTRESLYEKLQSLQPEELIVAEELHENGEPHLHAVLKMAQRTRFSGSQLTKLIGQKGHYEAARSFNKVKKYVLKEDPKPKTSKPIAKKEKISAVIANAIMQGKSFQELTDVDPGFCLLHVRTIHEFMREIQKPAAPQLQPLLLKDFETSKYAAVLQWLANNLFKERHQRQPQLFIHGPPACGKTRFAIALQKFARVYTPSYDEEWADDYEDDLFDIVIFDEFKNQRKLLFMNAFIGGQPMKLKRKGRTAYEKKRAIPCIILSNYHPADCFAAGDSAREISISAFCSRLLTISVGEDFWDEIKTYL